MNRTALSLASGMVLLLLLPHAAQAALVAVRVPIENARVAACVSRALSSLGWKSGDPRTRTIRPGTSFTLCGRAVHIAAGSNLWAGAAQALARQELARELAPALSPTNAAHATVTSRTPAIRARGAMRTAPPLLRSVARAPRLVRLMPFIAGGVILALALLCGILASLLYRRQGESVDSASIEPSHAPAPLPGVEIIATVEPESTADRTERSFTVRVTDIGSPGRQTPNRKKDEPVRSTIWGFGPWSWNAEQRRYEGDPVKLGTLELSRDHGSVALDASGITRQLAASGKLGTAVHDWTEKHGIRLDLSAPLRIRLHDALAQAAESAPVLAPA